MSSICRLCNAELTEPFINLGSTPLANSYLSEEDFNKPEVWYPLCVYVCSKCLLVQLPEHETAGNIFGKEYLYFSSYSEAWVEHARRYTEQMIERFGLKRGDDLVVEIGSNDGYLLQHFQANGFHVLGVEPAPNVAKVSIDQGIPTLIDFFGARVAKQIPTKASLIHGVNVFAHVPDLHDFTEGLRYLLADNGVVTLEFPHLPKLVENIQFDTIYHEHFSYFTLKTAELVLGAHDLSVFDVEQLPTHGGSIRIYGCHIGSRPASDRLVELRDEEKTAGYNSLERYRGFDCAVEKIKTDLIKFLIDTKATGKKVVGFGAPAKGNTLLNYCGVRQDLLPFTVDDSPHKQGRYLPGSRIPILPTATLVRANPDYVLILPWNLRDEIVGKLSRQLLPKTKFVIPIPRLEIT